MYSSGGKFLSKSKAKGTAHENDIRDRLIAAGLNCKRQPGSGMYMDYPDDVIVEIAGAEYLLEIKYRQDAMGFKMIYKWMEQSETSDILVLKPDLRKKIYDEPLYVMKESTFLGLVKDMEEK